MTRPPYFLLRPRALSPLLMTCEHASRTLTADLGPVSAAARSILASHRGWDIGIWSVVREISRRLGVTAIGGRYSRLVVDLNRDPSDPSLIVVAADGVPLPFNEKLTPREASRRVARIHTPYHAEIDSQLARRSACSLPPFLVSFHSFTPLLNPRRRRFDVGVLFRDHRRLAACLGSALVREGLSVRYNRPYSGLEGLIYAAARHGMNHRVPYLELEFNQRLLATAGGSRQIAIRTARALAQPLR